MSSASINVILTPIIYSELFGSQPTIEDLTALVRIPEWKLIASRCIGIASISLQHGVEDPDHQQMLFREFGLSPLYGPALAAILRRDSHRRLYTREGLLAILRVAVVNQVEPGTVLSDLEFADLFHKCMLMANELVVNELNPDVPEGGAKDLLATELRSILAQQQNLHDLIARTAALFEWSDSSRGAAHGGALPLREDFERFTGLSPEAFAAATYLTLARPASMRTWNDVVLHGPAFDADAWLTAQGVVEKSVPLTWLERHTVSMVEARNEWATQASLSFAGAESLWKTPLVLDDDDLLFMPSPFFVANMLGDGAYFELFDGYGERNTAFSTLYGHFFQDYVEDRFRAGYSGRSDVQVWTDVTYENGRSSDVIVNEAGHVIFVEVVAKRMQLVGSVLRLSETTIADDLRMGVTEKLGQLQDSIDAFRANKLLPEIPRVAGQRVYPVLVAPREWPRMYVLLHLLKTQPFDQLFPDCEPVELLDVGEVEDLEGRLNLGLSLAHLLDRKNRSASFNRAISMHNYLTVVEPGTYPIERSPTRVKGGELAKSLIELAQTWMAPKN
jgi:hypothetical protein